MTTYYHGGYPRLKVGDQLLPPDQTHAKHTLSSYAKHERPDATYAHRTDVVYLVTDMEMAAFYAAMYPGGGRVYIVEPKGLLTPDPDCKVPGMSWCCPSAEVLVASPSKVKVSSADLARFLAA